MKRGFRGESNSTRFIECSHFNLSLRTTNSAHRFKEVVTFLGELDRVADEVNQDLADSQ
jgi:hypothetical protein